MQPHEIERRQPQADRVEIILSVDPALFWFRGHFAVQPLLRASRRLTGRCITPPPCWRPAGAFTIFTM